MATRTINYKFNQSDSVDITSYDPIKCNVGSLIKFYTGGNSEDNYVGPTRLGLARPMEQSVAIPAIFISAVRWSPNIDWVFYGDQVAANVTRRIGMYEFNRTTSEYSWKGLITLAYPAIGNKTVRGQEVTYDLHTVGTVSVSGTTVTGVGTSFQTDGVCVGNRVGFTSIDPNAIVTWYEVSSVNSDTSITLVDIAPTLSSQPYVIEDLRFVQIVTNSTAVNGGLHLVKGLRSELFTAAGNTIPAATTVDNIRAVYWIKDAVTQTHTLGYGVALDEKASFISQDAYCINANAAASGRIFKYNVRAPLTSIVSGATTESYLLQTAQIVTIGNISATGNGFVASPSHGPGIGVKSLYWVTTTRIYRSDLSQIVTNGISYQTDAMIEVPPGTANTYAITNSFSSIEYSPSLDRFIILTTGASGARSYVTQYNTSANPFEVIFLSEDRQLDQSLASPDGVIHPSINGSSFTGRAIDGILHLCRFSGAVTLSQMYSIPIGAHQFYAFDSGQHIISPKFNLSGANKLSELIINNIRILGSDTFALATEPFRVYYRTTGIDDNTGSWILLNSGNDLSGISPGEIQFAITFRTLGTSCIPARLKSINVIYEDNSTDSHYIPSVSKSSTTNRIFSYFQSTVFGGTIPELRIRIYNAVTASLVLDDTTTSQVSGTFEYSTDGTVWNPWSTSADVIGNYIRYTATSLPSSIKVRVLLTQ
jgi:hypothetical protein